MNSTESKPKRYQKIWVSPGIRLIPMAEAIQKSREMGLEKANKLKEEERQKTLQIKKEKKLNKSQDPSAHQPPVTAPAVTLDKVRL